MPSGVGNTTPNLESFLQLDLNKFSRFTGCSRANPFAYSIVSQIGIVCYCGVVHLVS